MRLTPLLTLPPSFGAAYVGESFACTLCANNERLASDPIAIRDVSIAAELQTPSSQAREEQGVELKVDVVPPPPGHDTQEGGLGAVHWEHSPRPDRWGTGVGRAAPAGTAVRWMHTRFPCSTGGYM